MPFHELVALIKDRYLRPGSLVDVATDVGLIFDRQEGAVLKHVNIGPMEKRQLNTMFLVWPRDDIPEPFSFANLGYQEDRETPFDVNHLSAVLDASARWQSEQAEGISADLTAGRV